MSVTVLATLFALSVWFAVPVPLGRDHDAVITAKAEWAGTGLLVALLTFALSIFIRKASAK
jgi:hypothetical protein